MLQTNSSIKVSFYTFGCRLNQSETAVIEQSFTQRGYTIVSPQEPADIFIVNTCTVTERGDEETLQLVKKINRTNPNAQIALVGCQAQMQKEKLAQLPNVRWVVGNARKMDLLNIVEDQQSSSPNIVTPKFSRKAFTIPFLASDKGHTRATIKIQDGCDFFCSFCEIPYARGRARSREFNDILREARQLSDLGHKEIILAGINIGTYRHQDHTIMDVINALEQIEGLMRIRISSIEPTTIPLSLIEKMATKTKLCRYLHIPLQNADDHILSVMKRKYSFKEFKEFVTLAYEKVSGIQIGTDLITGFPGETDECFANSLERINKIPLHYIHVFSYSSRTMAKSQHLKDEIPSNIIQRRSVMARELSLRKKLLFNQQFLNTTQNVLFEYKRKGIWSGLTDNYLRVHVNSDYPLKNKLCQVMIDRADSIGLYGQLIS